MKKSSLVFFAVILLILSCGYGCSSSANIDMVKNGIMPDGYDTITIANAFGGSFDNPAWEEIVTEKGEKIVQFSGAISHKTHDAAVAVIKREYSFTNLINGVVSSEKYEKELQNKEYDTQAGAEELIQRWLKNDFWAVGTPITAQWTLSIDEKTFKFRGLYADIWEGIGMKVILDIIYE